MRRNQQYVSRRRFLGQASCSAIGSASLLSSLIHLRLTGSLAAADTGEGEDYKALVCVFLAGGNDSFNMLAPVDSAQGYPEYLAARAEVALPQVDFTPIGDPLPSPDGRTLGLNAEMPELKALFDSGKASFINNVGTLVEPVTKLEIQNQSAKLPLGLYSHSDQQLHWQSGLPRNFFRAGAQPRFLREVLPMSLRFVSGTDGFTDINSRLRNQFLMPNIRMHSRGLSLLRKGPQLPQVPSIGLLWKLRIR